MRTSRYSLLSASLSVFIALVCSWPRGTRGKSKRRIPSAKTVEITSAQTDYEVGQRVKFSAVAKDEAGKPLSEKPVRWFAAPFDVAAMDENGTASFYQPGEVTIGVFLGGKPQFTKIIVKPAPG